MKLLLVDDDTLLSAALAELLKASHYIVDLANNGQTGLELATLVEYDLILLDWLIPKLDGMSLCRKLRSQGYSKPILLLTAKNRNADIIAGLDAGADDYVIKPYDPQALLAKIRSLLRRSGTSTSSQLTWGNLSLDLIAARVSVDQTEIQLTATEYKLLELFLHNPNRIFSRRVILDRLWGFDDAPIENAVTTHIKDLRKKLKAQGLTEELLETVYGMGYRLKSAPEATSQLQKTDQKKRTPDLSSVNRFLEQFHDSFGEQIVVLEQVKTALLSRNLAPELQQTAQMEVHKLAGFMGTFGYPEGSRLARRLEQVLIKKTTFTDEDITEFCQSLTALQQELTKSPVTLATQPTPQQQIYRVLVIDDDTLVTKRLQTQAQTWRMEITIALDLTTARSHLVLATPDAVLLDLSIPEREEDGLTILAELRQTYPDLPIIILTGGDTLADRLTVSRLGAQQFLHKSATDQQIFQAIARVLPQAKYSEAKVLIVDDDPLMLAALSNLLTPWGLEVTTLVEPQQFWEVLMETKPDLVLLDLEMPVVNGLDLCQVVRQDTQWGDVPILVVTAHDDAASLQRAFAAGADDFINKPVLGPELVTRVLSRIERRRRDGHRGNE